MPQPNAEGNGVGAAGKDLLINNEDDDLGGGGGGGDWNDDTPRSMMKTMIWGMMVVKMEMVVLGMTRSRQIIM